VTRPRFAMIGAAGFVARRHLDAIRDVGGELAAALDLHDSVGILDSYFPGCRFFTSPERFDRHLNKPTVNVDYVVVCSPNWLHDAHCRWALRAGCHAICEKPLCLEPWNVDHLVELEAQTGRSIYPILQLRVHPDITELRDRVARDGLAGLSIRYVTTRGSWYRMSWKGDVKKSGGPLMNLGIHFFDALSWIYGAPEEIEGLHLSDDAAWGCLKYEGADVRWFLSTRAEDLSPRASKEGMHADRRILDAQGNPVADFSQNFTSYHTDVYRRILDGLWHTAKDARGGIALVHDIREKYEWASHP